MVLAEPENLPSEDEREDATSRLITTLETIDETIHQKVRLGIMSALVARGECDFRFLKDTLSVTDGNLSIHLARLEEAGYISVHKEFVKRKPHTTYAPTEKGKQAFTAYLAALERIVQSAGAYSAPAGAAERKSSRDAAT